MACQCPRRVGWIAAPQRTPAHLAAWLGLVRCDGFGLRSGCTRLAVTGEVRVKLYKGSCAVQGRRSPLSLYDSRLANQSNLELFDNQWAQGFTSLWILPTRVAARLHPTET